MAVQERLLTVGAFEHFVQLPENRNRLFEYIGGRVVNVVSNNYSSRIMKKIWRSKLGIISLLTQLSGWSVRLSSR